jgi:DHA3 family macrolide efflux protein-like MFS transporter
MTEETANPLEEAMAAEEVPTPLPPSTPEPLSMGQVLRISAMRRMWYAQIVSTLGDFLALFAIIDIMTFKLHATPQQVTGLNIAYLLPIALLGILSGVFVDRWPLKPTMVGSDFLRAGLCLLLFAVHSITGFYFVMACISILSSFFSPAQGVAVRSIVPMNGLRSANALLQQVMMMMRVIGAPIAITIVNLFSAKACYGIDAVSFLASGCLIASIALIVPQKAGPKKPIEAGAAKKGNSAIRGILTDMKGGASFIFHHAGLLFVITALAAGMFIMGCFGPLIAIYVRDTLHASSTVFGVVSPSVGVGMLIGVNVLNAAAKKIANTTQVYLGLGGIALGTLMLAVAPLAAVNVPFTHLGVPVVLSVLACLLIGFACAGIVVPAQTLIQMETPSELMGRVGSTTMSSIFAAQIGGLLLSGILAQHTSVRIVFALCTAMVAVLMVAGKLWMDPGHTQAAKS